MLNVTLPNEKKRKERRRSGKQNRKTPGFVNSSPLNIFSLLIQEVLQPHSKLQDHAMRLTRERVLCVCQKSGINVNLLGKLHNTTLLWGVGASRRVK